MLNSVFLFFSFSGSEIMLILFVALILFGGDKFPEIARGLGKGIREFKDMSDGVKREIHQQINNHDLDPMRNNNPATTSTEAPQPATEPLHDHAADPHETHDIAVTSHDTPAVTETHEKATASNETIAEAPKKPDLSQPPNTISHQSY